MKKMNEGSNYTMSGAEDQQFCLKWNNFQSNIMSQFETLKENGDFVDVTLSCHGRSIKAHRVVLSACSPYLKNLFKDNPCKHPIIILDNVSYTDLESLMAFVYTGQVFVAQNELSSFLKAAESLQIRGLTDNSTAPQEMLNVEVPPVSCSSSGSMDLKKRRASEGVSDEEAEPQYRSKKPTRRCSAPYIVDQEDCEMRRTHEWLVSGESQLPEPGRYISSGLYAGDSSHADTAGLLASTVDADNSMGDGRKPHSLDPRPCPLCNRVYSNLSNLRQHMRLIHNPTVVTCKLCAKTFKTDLYLRRHLVSFHELNLNSFVSIEPVPGQRGVGAGPPMWPRPVKPEPLPFKDLVHTSDVY